MDSIDIGAIPEGDGALLRFTGGAGFGASVALIGDLNGDGFGDFAVGSPAYGAGYVAVIFGQGGESPFPAEIDVTALDGARGFLIRGEAALDAAGASLAAAGDVNGDGVADLIVGASRADSGAGAAYVVFGRGPGESFGPTLDLDALDGRTGFRIAGEATGDFAGTDVAAAGDVNGDGFGDIIIGSFSSDAGAVDSGAVHVVFGGPTGPGAPDEIRLADLDGNNGFRLVGPGPASLAGGFVAGGGDLNGDGLDDVAIGTLNNGPVFVVFGRAAGDGFAASSSLGALGPGEGLRIDGATRAVAFIDDINGDGRDDLAVADSNLNGQRGRVAVIFGRAAEDPFGASINVAALTGSDGFRAEGSAEGDRVGFALASADLNGDGLGDLAIGAPSFTDIGGLTVDNRVFVLFGRPQGERFPAEIDLESLQPDDGFRVDLAKNSTQVSLATGPDVNGDGVDDLLIGRFSPGTAALIFGPRSIGEGGDRIKGDPGPNDLDGLGGDDTILGLGGADTLRGSAGADELFGGAGADSLLGGDGNDSLDGGADADTISGEAGADRLDGGEGDDSLDGGPGADTLDGGEGADRLAGGEGADSLLGGADDDTLDGGAGADILSGGGGRNRIEGGAGADLLVLDGARAEYAVARSGALLTLSRGGEVHVVSGVEGFLFGEEFASLAALIAPPPAPPPAAPPPLTPPPVAPPAPAAAPTEGADDLSGGDGGDRIDALGGDDLVSGRRGADTLIGGAGRDTLLGGAGDDSLLGGRGADLLVGGAGRNGLFGEGGADLLIGGREAETLSGGAGADRIEGGRGNDLLIGGSGRDRFQFSAGDGRDAIRDFRQGQDRIEFLSGADAFDDLVILQRGEDALIRHARGSIFVENQNAGDFTEDDFLF